MLSTGRHAPGAYTSVADGARQLYRAEGVSGFYRGLIPSLFGVSHGAVQFMAYEQLKNWRQSTRTAQALSMSSTPSKVELSNWDFLTLSAVSKIFAGSITYPYQVVRARLQTYDARAKYANARDVMRQVWAKEGVSGFYKGCVVDDASDNFPAIFVLLIFESQSGSQYCPRPTLHLRHLSRVRKHQVLPAEILPT